MISFRKGPSTYPRDRSAAIPDAVFAQLALLRELAAVVESLSDEQYVAVPPGLATSNIGRHVRHSLERIDALLTGLRAGLVDYDRRCLGTDVEDCRSAALETMARQEHDLLNYPWGSGGWPLQVSVLLTPSGSTIEVASSSDRELAFVVSHTIHHNALIGMIAATLGASVPENFGYAPATLANRKGGQPCAR